MKQLRLKKKKKLVIVARANALSAKMGDDTRKLSHDHDRRHASRCPRGERPRSDPDARSRAARPPETAHGGSVLAVFDALANASAPREVSGIYRRRVPLGTPLTLLRSHADSTETFVLSDPVGGVLVDGRVAPLAAR